MSRTETNTRTILTFSELPEERQSLAVDWYLDNVSHHDADACSAEWGASMDAAREAFGFHDGPGREPVSLNYPGTWWDIDAAMALPEHGKSYFGSEPVNLVGVRAWKWAMREWAPKIGEPGSCPFTGYCGDECFLEPMRRFFRRPRPSDGLESVLEACATSFVRAWEADIESAYAEDTIRERLTDGIDGYEWDAADTGGAPI